MFTTAPGGERSAGAGRGSGAMMAIGNVEAVDLPERIDDRLVLRGRHLPHLVTHAVNGGEIKQRRLLNHPRHDRIDRFRGAIRQEHRSRLRADREHVLRAIVFLIRTRLFVFLDQTAIVLVDRIAGGHAGLHVRSHVQPVEIKARRLLDHERRIALELGEVLLRKLIHRIRVRIRAGRKIDLRPRHVEKAEGISRGQRAGFLSVYDVIRNCSDRRSGFRNGP